MFKTNKKPQWQLALLGMFLAACVPVRSDGVAPTPRIDSSPVGQMAPVEYVGVEIGVGSPIPVQVVIDTSFPDPCAQLVAVQQSVAGTAFTITITTSPADPDCASPAGTLPFRLAVPLNAAGLAPGAYTVSVNDVTTTFDYELAAH